MEGTMQGTVKRVQRKGKRTALLIDGTWYSTFEPIEIQEGDRVAFEYRTTEKNGRQFHNLTAWEVLNRSENSRAGGAKANSGKGPGGELLEAERIARSVALKAAVESCGPGMETAEVLDTAEAFLEFLLNGKVGRDDGRFHDRTGIMDEDMEKNPF